MGFTTVAVFIHNPVTPAQGRELKLTADTGVMYSIVPRQVLDDLGIRPLTRRRFALANGERIERDLGTALYRVEEYVGHAPVIFGEEGDQ